MRNLKKENNLPQEKISTITWENMTWVDIVSPTTTAMDFLKEKYHFQQLALEDCLSHRQISKMDVFPDYLFFIFHFSYYDKQTRISTKRKWAAFIGKDFIVTVHNGELKALVDLFVECQINNESQQKYFKNGSGYLLYQIIDKAIDSYFPVLDKIMSLLEKTEDSVFDADNDATMELSILRRDIITQRVVMFPTRALLIEIRSQLNRYSKVELTSNYDDLIDHLAKICQVLDECNEVIQVFKDSDYTLATQRLNHVVRVLNIIATIVLPFLAISSIYGMNVPLPGGLEHGSMTTFIVLFAFMIMITVGMLVYFRHRRWI
jgi:magnesium transporter